MLDDFLNDTNCATGEGSHAGEKGADGLRSCSCFLSPILLSFALSFYFVSARPWVASKWPQTASRFPVSSVEYNPLASGA